jgi:hypothetical protein
MNTLSLIHLCRFSRLPMVGERQSETNRSTFICSKHWYSWLLSQFDFVVVVFVDQDLCLRNKTNKIRDTWASQQSCWIELIYHKLHSCYYWSIHHDWMTCLLNRWLLLPLQIRFPWIDDCKWITIVILLCSIYIDTIVWQCQWEETQSKMSLSTVLRKKPNRKYVVSQLSFVI